jgi:aarF domain-containing kinase
MASLIGGDIQYRVPKVIEELTTERIFTSEFANGVSLDWAADNLDQETRNYIGELVMKLTLRELFEWKYM